MVTFQVDMSQMVISPSGVHLAGNFQGWEPSSSAMVDIGGGVYALTIDLPPGVYQFKFVNGNTWGADEIVPLSCGVDDGGGNINREITVVSDVVLTAVCFAQCDPCGVASYVMNGNASSMGGDCYQVTPAAQWQNGAFWSNTQIDLLTDFNLQFEINLGSSDSAGADGVVFVMQRLGSAALGVSGGGMGYSSFGQSLGIEFDTFENIEYSDPQFDHIAIEVNGDVDHLSLSNLAGPVKMSATAMNTEDGLNHTVGIQWEASTQTLSIYFDCEFRLQATYDLVNLVFGGESLVFWGFTGATGDFVNQQMICASPSAMQVAEVEICPGSNTMISAGESVDGVYNWTPAVFLDNPFIENPVASPDTTMVYEVTYLDLCNVLTTKQVTVHVLESGAGCFFLPVELIAFDVISTETENKFFWTTAAESSVLYYAVEESADGLQYHPIHLQGSYGDEENRYEVYGTRNRNDAYFRLCQRDTDGAYHVLSDAHYIEGLRLDKPDVYYSSVDHSLRVSTGRDRGDVLLKIFSADGKLLLEELIGNPIQSLQLPAGLKGNNLCFATFFDDQENFLFAKKLIIAHH